ncbi:hypothetical protein E4665_15795 [Sporolactobacillus shoreae]|uniref:Uncharacterized protein n=1 Tax=Sporolactobacillus shoreae TaxID=1465501 RepID=A0A4Z0GJV5_9BACL|nr:hypothetical protein [Sporolactobacillus shoreae]TGA96326.1 hypothetical protein E4665_15795 [Sporolactobacillus shoreae]
MKQQMNIRLDEVHQILLDESVKKLTVDGVKTNKTDVIEKALFMYARDILGRDRVTKIIDNHYVGMY